MVTWGDADEVGSIRRRSFELHGARITVEASGPDAPAVVDAVWPSDARPIDGDEVDQVCTVEVAGHRRGDRSRVLVGGELVAEVADRDAVVDELASAIDFAVAEHATERVYLHAGVVAWGDRAIVVPGRSLSGKTTLVAALVRAGATYLSDEFAPIDREGRVWPHARPLSVRAEGTSPWYSAAHDEFAVAMDYPVTVELARVGAYLERAVRCAEMVRVPLSTLMSTEPGSTPGRSAVST